MHSLAEQLIYTTVRLEGKTANGTSVGTGFYFMHQNRIFIITNKHVVDGVIEGHFVAHKGKYINNERQLVDGNGVSLPFTGASFIGHPDPKVDVAAMNISDVINRMDATGESIYWMNITKNEFLTNEIIEKFIGPIEEITFVGYPNGLWDSVNLQPIARKGITATACYKKFMGERKFLVDASVFPGSSGSPVFIYYAGGYPDKSGKLYIGNRMHFLGIISQVYMRQEQGEIKIINVPTAEQKAVAEVNQMIDLGIVFNSETIQECAEHFLNVIAPFPSQPPAQ